MSKKTSCILCDKKADTERQMSVVLKEMEDCPCKGPLSTKVEIKRGDKVVQEFKS